jgi:diadenosine tetraphosphatase ApaH/serine/threonine PP2A family protein phosphatase
VGGDVAPGAMTPQVIETLRGLGERAHFVRGNGDREVVEAFDADQRPDPSSEDVLMRMLAAEVARLDRAGRDFLAAFAPVVRLDADDLGPTLFCHGSPRSDTEMITQITPPERLGPMLAGVAERTIVCGHTHHQFVLEHDGRRIVNAGAVGMPYEGVAAAFWLLLGPDVEMRRTDYDVEGAIATMRAAGPADIEEAMLDDSLVNPTDADTVARIFEDRATAPG